LTHPASFLGETPTIHLFEAKKVFVMDVLDKRSRDESEIVQIGITPPALVIPDGERGEPIREP